MLVCVSCVCVFCAVSDGSVLKLRLIKRSDLGHSLMCGQYLFTADMRDAMRISCWLMPSEAKQLALGLFRSKLDEHCKMLKDHINIIHGNQF